MCNSHFDNWPSWEPETQELSLLSWCWFRDWQRSPDPSEQLVAVVKESLLMVMRWIQSRNSCFPWEKAAQGLGLGWLIGSHFYLLVWVLRCFSAGLCDLWLGLPLHSESLNSRSGSWQVFTWSDLRGHCVGTHSLKVYLYALCTRTVPLLARLFLVNCQTFIFFPFKDTTWLLEKTWKI